MITIIFYLLFFLTSLFNLIMGAINVDLIPAVVHNNLEYLGSLIARFDVWVPELLPLLFQKLEWLLWVLIAILTYDIIVGFMRSRKI